MKLFVKGNNHELQLFQGNENEKMRKNNGKLKVQNYNNQHTNKEEIQWKNRLGIVNYWAELN